MVLILRRAKQTAALAVAAALALGCAGPGAAPGAGPGASRDMNAAMARWKGRRAYEAVAMWGMPDAVTREGMLGRLRWNADPKATGARPWGQPFAAPAGGEDVAPRRQEWATRCARTLAVDAQEIVQFATWSRSEGCSTDPTDYLPPP